MPEWLVDAVQPDTGVTLLEMAQRLALAVLAGAIVAVIYRKTRQPGPEGVPLVSTLVLLTVLIALVTMAIGNSVARAFSLVGALSIVRFRTVVDDARDTAFVIFAVAIGMLIGTGVWIGAVVGVPIVGLAAAAIAIWERYVAPQAYRYSVLTLRLGLGHEPSKAMAECLNLYLSKAQLTAAGTAKQGAAVDFTYTVQWRGEPAIVALVQTLNKIEGVQSVEVRPG